jgi:UDP-N-acetylglucosamine acyltransferase
VSSHPLSVVSSQARIGRHVRIGPFCVVEPDVTIGDGCTLQSHVVLRNGITLGAGNLVCEGAVLGGLPQHVHASQRPGRVVIGSGNTIRENVTIHRALEEDQSTTVGDNNLLMVNAHVAHDCHVGNHVIVANNTMLAGHIEVADRAYLSGAVAVHQFCRIGSLAMVGGQAHVNQDVPPYVTVDGESSCVVGVNQIGLRRAGFTPGDVRRLKEAYRVIYRRGLKWQEILDRLRSEFSDGLAALFYQFLSTTTRGILSERRLPPGATLKLRRQHQEEEARLRAKAG